MTCTRLGAIGREGEDSDELVAQWDERHPDAPVAAQCDGWMARRAAKHGMVSLCHTHRRKTTAG